MNRMRCLIIVLLLFVTGLIFIAPDASAGGTGQCQVTGLSVKGTGSSVHPCKFMIPHDSVNEYQVLFPNDPLPGTPLQHKCLRVYDMMYSVMVCFVNLVTNYTDPQLWPSSEKSYTSFYAATTLVRCLTPAGANLKCTNLKLQLREVDGGKSHYMSIICGFKGHATCPTWGYTGHYYVSGTHNWLVGGSTMGDSTGCRTQRATITGLTATVAGNTPTAAGLSEAARSTAYWKACDRTS